ncbi:hypothetical protein [Actinomadura macra]|uniref:hypothetical protein n=1 Tax=Actinomadura macra TaxID=46164 RepID=UPI00082C1AB9|nr:hypothetical protein [Actinomadura macra]
MQGNWNNQQAYYRCRFAAEYAAVNELDHPKVVYLREAEILGEVDGWLATAFTPDRINAAIDMMTDQTVDPDAQKAADLRQQLLQCDRKLARYRAALDAGADPAEVTGWINDVKTERRRLENEAKTAPRHTGISREQIAETLRQTGDLAQLAINAEPQDKADLYQKLGLTMTYYPQKHEVEARVIPEPPHVRSVCVRGLITTIRTYQPPPRSAMSTASQWGPNHPPASRSDSWALPGVAAHGPEP